METELRQAGLYDHGEIGSYEVKAIPTTRKQTNRSQQFFQPGKRSQQVQQKMRAPGQEPTDSG
ncbi:hypothetical protein FV139_11190 [Parahaliea maris]|uniref:Uncharacterized protein n=1 Tax=Parahaliea maris TaxID=2716870 RepID=A0A5C9A064_9GAMM|nr:hypothetical protein [Parahaliea maris]TXS94156.1 hypothetical protein FV139_11190 [Parahaliea maris]